MNPTTTDHLASPALSGIRVAAPATVGNIAGIKGALACALSLTAVEVIARPFPCEANDPRIRIHRKPTHAIYPATISDDSALLKAIDDLLTEAAANENGLKLLPNIGISLEILHVAPKAFVQAGCDLGIREAEIVATLFAVSEYLEHRLPKRELLPFMELAGGQPDRLAACLLGSFIFVRAAAPIDAHRLYAPALFVTLVATDAPCATPIHSPAANAAAVVLGLLMGDVGLLSRALADTAAKYATTESPSLPFIAVQQAALAAGALGVGVSSDDCTVFALSKNSLIADAVAAAQATYTPTLTAKVNDEGVIVK